MTNWKKGDKVTLFGHLNRKGGTYFKHMTVYSCGKKQMVLVDDAGEKFKGRHVQPDCPYVVARMSDEAALEQARALSVVDVWREAISLRLCLVRNPNASPGYIAATRREEAALALVVEPAAWQYDAWMDMWRAKWAAEKAA
jgi:hypothetical protein